MPLPPEAGWTPTPFPRDYESPDLAWEYPDGKTSMESTKISLEGLKGVLKELGKS